MCVTCVVVCGVFTVCVVCVVCLWCGGYVVCLKCAWCVCGMCVVCVCVWDCYQIENNTFSMRNESNLTDGRVDVWTDIEIR